MAPGTRHQLVSVCCHLVAQLPVLGFLLFCFFSEKKKSRWHACCHILGEETGFHMNSQSLPRVIKLKNITECFGPQDADQKFIHSLISLTGLLTPGHLFI